MHFITNSYKRFSKTNSTDPRQRVPLTETQGLTSYLSYKIYVTGSTRIYTQHTELQLNVCRAKQ